MKDSAYSNINILGCISYQNFKIYDTKIRITAIVTCWP